MHQIIIYTKPGCHLCEDVEIIVNTIAKKRNDIIVHLQNICEDPADFEKYQYDIPVVFLNGKEISRHRLTAEQLATRLKSEPES